MTPSNTDTAGRSGGTRVGITPTRLPAAARIRLLGLARRGIQLLMPAGSRGELLLLQLCDGLERALVDLAVTEGQPTVVRP